MPKVAVLDDAHRCRRERARVYESWLMRGDVSQSRETPTCKLIEQDPNSILTPHFHAVDQFQVVVAGSGAFGKVPVRPMTVHYAGAYTPYGPITTEDGIEYFVARNGVDLLAAFRCRKAEPNCLRFHAATLFPRRSRFSPRVYWNAPPIPSSWPRSRPSTTGWAHGYIVSPQVDIGWPAIPIRAADNST